MIDEEIQISDAYLLRNALASASTEMLDNEMDKLFAEIKDNKEIFEHLNEILSIDNRGIKKKSVS